MNIDLADLLAILAIYAAPHFVEVARYSDNAVAISTPSCKFYYHIRDGNVLCAPNRIRQEIQQYKASQYSIEEYIEAIK